MKVFVSWSGERGRAFAEAVCALLASTSGDARLEPWMSTRIRHGRPWATELLGQLDQCRACIVCLTADTVASRWLAFEAGAVLGAGAAPDQVVSLGLDLEPGLLEGHALANFEAFDASKEGLRGLWERLRLGSEPTWSSEAWAAFEAACAAVPSAATRAFTLFLRLPRGLFEHLVEIDHDMRFDDVLARLLEVYEAKLDGSERAAFRFLDIDGEQWLPMPSRLSLVPVRRLAVLHPDVFREHGGSARSISMQLREGIDVIPKVNTALAVLRRDLRDVLATQTAYRARHGRYAASLEELQFLPAPGNYLDLIGSDLGFAAAGRCDKAPSVYGVRAGDGAGRFADKPEGEVFLVGMR